MKMKPKTTEYTHDPIPEALSEPPSDSPNSGASEDATIIELFFARSEAAISRCMEKYGRYCHTIAERILHSREDAEECVSDTWLRAWHSIPPARPTRLKGYLGTIARHLALDRLDASRAQKRGEAVEVAEEFWECLPSDEASVADEAAFRDSMDRFLSSLDSRTRVVFLRRYWYICPVREIAEGMGMSEGAVKTLLHRTRVKLKEFLDKEGISI